MPKQTTERIIDRQYSASRRVSALPGTAGATINPGLSTIDVQGLIDASIVTHTAISNAHHAPVVAGNGVAVVGPTQVVSINLVGANPGLVVSGSGLALGTPSSVGASTTNTVGGSGHTHAVVTTSDGAVNPGVILATDGAGLVAVNTVRTTAITSAADVSLNPTGVVRLPDGKAIKTVSFAPGFTGNGLQLDQGVATAGKTSLELDNLTVRGLLSVYEFLIRKISIAGGSTLISDGCKVTGVTFISGSSYQIDTDPEHEFAANDLIWAKKYSTGVYDSKMQVTSITNTKRFVATLVSGNAPAIGYEYGRIGNTTDATRQGVIYLTSRDSGAPYISIVDGVNSFAAWGTAGTIKTWMGKLSSLSDADFPSMTGYGFYSSNAYLKGTVSVAADVVRLDSTGVRVKANAASGAFVTTNAYRFAASNGFEIGGLYGFDWSGSYSMGYQGYSEASKQILVGMGAKNHATGTGATTYIESRNNSGSEVANITLYADNSQSYIIVGAADYTQFNMQTRSTSGHRPSSDLGANLGEASYRWGTLYVNQVIASSISGATMNGQEWEYSGSMVIDANGALDTTVSVTNQGAGRADLDVDRNIIVGGTVDGVDVSAFNTLYNTHIGNVNAHHAQSHVLASTTALGPDHTVSGLTAGQVLRASGATTAAFTQLNFADLGGSVSNAQGSQFSLTDGSRAFSGAVTINVATVTPPLVIGVNGQNQTVVGLSADYLDNQHGTFYQNAGNLNAGTILAARMPAMTGDATSTVGTVALTLANSGVTAGNYTKVTVDAKGRVTAGTNALISDLGGTISNTQAPQFLLLDGTRSMTGAFLAVAGTAALPGIAIGAANTGFFRSATNFINIATAGVERGRITNSGFSFGAATDPTEMVDVTGNVKASGTVKSGTFMQSGSYVLSTTYVEATTGVRIGLGSASAPTVSLLGYPTTGLFGEASAIGFTTAGTRVGKWVATGLKIGATGDATQALDITGSILASGSITVGSDTDTAHVFGRGKLGFGTAVADEFAIAHFDFFTASNYALKQTSTGNVMVNAPSTKFVQLRTNNAVRLEVNDSGVSVPTTMTARDILPETTDTYDIGSSTKFFRQQFVSQINAVIFAEQTAQIIGGWFIISKDQGVLPTVGSATTQINFGKLMTPGDVIIIRNYDTAGNIKAEYMSVGTLVSGTTYNVNRDLANAHTTDPSWSDGTPYAVWGQTGDGRIEINAYDTPRVSLMKMNSGAYNSEQEYMRFGDLNGVGGVSAGNSWGVFIGDSTDYLKYVNGTLTIAGNGNGLTNINGGNILATSSIGIGNATFGASGFQVQHNGGSPRMHIGNGATVYFKYESGAITVENAEVKVTSAGNRQVSINSSRGIDIEITNAQTLVSSYSFSAATTTVGGLYGQRDTTFNALNLSCGADGGRTAGTTISALTAATEVASTGMTVQSGSKTAWVTLSSGNNTSPSSLDVSPDKALFWAQGANPNKINLSIGSASGSFGSGEGVVFLANSYIVPFGNPTGGSLLYSESGVLKHRNTSGLITAIAGGDTGEAWVTLTLTTGASTWVNFDTATFSTCAYKRLGDVVFLKGLAKRTAGTGTIIGILPSGYRPPKTVILTTSSNDAYGQIRVDTSGNITVTTGSPTAWVGLDGLWFSTN